MAGEDEKAAEEKTAETADEADEPTDDLVTTRHSLTIKRRKLGYTATAGRMVLREESISDGAFEGHQAKAEMFVVAYTLDGADPTTRAVTFAFNGGPGSSSVWLHLGLLGPRRVAMGDAGSLQPPPYGLADNAQTLLAHSDLVFIDPVSTGYSRAVTGGKPADYHSYTKDLESIAEVIRLWTSRNQRWLSPKFLAGESYGTLRAAALSQHLQRRHGMYLNGLMLISSVLDMGTIRFTEGNDVPYSLFLPSYAAIAHYHGRHGSRSLRSVLDEAEAFASDEYPRALAAGTRLPSSEHDAVVTRLAGLTGLSEEYLRQVRLRPEHLRFFRELRRSEGLVVGRLDGRFTGWEADDAGERPSADPAHAAITGPYTAALNHYVRAELEYSSDLPYEILTDRVHPWSYSDFEGEHVSVAGELATAMRNNPHLRVHIGSGYHDGATPYFAAEHVLAALRIPDELRANIETRYYEAGHMMYIHEPSRIQQSSDLADFVSASSRR
ncbi:MAG: peptidase S10 [Pseudonocardiaceae bacterium]|nr:peptidase S10 [Pseudonocardiaceae bacterium]